VNLERKFALMKETKNGEARAAPLSSKAIEVLNAKNRLVALAVGS
jgi:hypothetical protein